MLHYTVLQFLVKETYTETSCSPNVGLSKAFLRPSLHGHPARTHLMVFLEDDLHLPCLSSIPLHFHVNDINAIVVVINSFLFLNKADSLH